MISKPIVREIHHRLVIDDDGQPCMKRIVTERYLGE
ncbi:hypothetical protein CELL_01026 [Cellulomonas sp. T2.31MG-18]